MTIQDHTGPYNFRKFDFTPFFHNSWRYLAICARRSNKNLWDETSEFASTPDFHWRFNIDNFDTLIFAWCHRNLRVPPQSQPPLVFRKMITGSWRANLIWSKHFLQIFAQIRTLKKWQLKCDLQMFFVIEELAHPFFSLAGQWKRSGVFFPKRKSFPGVVPSERTVQKWSDVFFLTNLSHAIWRNAFSNSTPLLFEQCSGNRFKEFFWGILRPKDWERVYILLFLLVGLKPTRSSSWLLQRCEMMRWFIHEAENELNTTRLLQAMIHCLKVPCFAQASVNKRT